MCPLIRPSATFSPWEKGLRAKHVKHALSRRERVAEGRVRGYMSVLSACSSVIARLPKRPWGRKIMKATITAPKMSIR